MKSVFCALFLHWLFVSYGRVVESVHLYEVASAGLGHCLWSGFKLVLLSYAPFYDVLACTSECSLLAISFRCSHRGIGIDELEEQHSCNPGSWPGPLISAKPRGARRIYTQKYLWIDPETEIVLSFITCWVFIAHRFMVTKWSCFGNTFRAHIFGEHDKKSRV